MNIDYSHEDELPKADRKAVDEQWVVEDRKLYPENFDDYECEKEFYITARVDGKLAGIASVFVSGGVLELSELMVFEAYRKQGIGSELLRRVEEEAHKRNCFKIWLQTSERLDAFRLYKKFGYQVEHVLKNHTAHYDDITMYKDLA